MRIFITVILFAGGMALAIGEKPNGGLQPGTNTQVQLPQLGTVTIDEHGIEWFFSRPAGIEFTRSEITVA